MRLARSVNKPKDGKPKPASAKAAIFACFGHPERLLLAVQRLVANDFAGKTVSYRLIINNLQNCVRAKGPRLPRGREDVMSALSLVKGSGRLRSRVVGISLLLLIPLSVLGQAPFTCTTNNGTITITGYVGPAGPVVIPTTVNGLPVTGINKQAFEGNPFSPITNLTSVTIPSSVTSIGEEAFVFCTSLTSLALGAGVTNFGENAFGASGLTNVTISNGATCLGFGIFSGCSRLGSIVIPNSIYKHPRLCVRTM